MRYRKESCQESSNQPHKMPPNSTKPKQQSSQIVSNTQKTPVRTTPKPILIPTRPKPVQVGHGFECKNSISSQNGQVIKRDFDYFALSMNWPETACRFLMTKGKTCDIPG